MTRDQLASKAATRGYACDASVTDDRLGRVHPRMLNGRPDLMKKALASHLDATTEQVREWTASPHYVAPYDLGEVGSEIIAPPTTDDAAKMVRLPSYSVVAVCKGSGESFDGDNIQPLGLTYTILRSL
jgi:hypothetical protein